jgi:tRNA modification GTPase
MNSAGESTNHAIVLTAPGASAIAVLRLAGPSVGAFLSQHVRRPVKEMRLIHADIVDQGETIDDAVIVLGQGGHQVDLNLHGGPWIVQRVLELAAREGFTVMPQGQLPPAASAVDADSQIQRDILTHLPLARTELGVRALMAQEAAWQAWERDPGAFDAKDILADQSLYRLLHPPRVAIVGPANAGKSTLANQLFAQERSITADVPGTTRDWVGEIANIDGLPVMLVDTPGLRETPDPIERQAIAHSQDQIQSADLVVLVLDATSPHDHAEFLSRFPGAIVVLNKIDRGSVPPKAASSAIRMVATTGAGVDDLRTRITAHFGCHQMDLNRPRWWTDPQRIRLRQRTIRR